MCSQVYFISSFKHDKSHRKKANPQPAAFHLPWVATYNHHVGLIQFNRTNETRTVLGIHSATLQCKLKPAVAAGLAGVSADATRNVGTSPHLQSHGCTDASTARVALPVISRVRLKGPFPYLVLQMANKDAIRQLLWNRKLCARGMLWLGEQKTPQTCVTTHLLQVLQEQGPGPATVWTSAVRDEEGGGSSWLVCF